MKLVKLLDNIDYEVLKGDTSIDIVDLSNDSRKIKEGYLFVATHGYEANGHDFIDKAILNGAVAVVICEDIEVKQDVVVIKVDNSNEIMMKLAMNLYDNPQDKLIKIGITGTKGKTTVSFMIKSMLETSGNSCGLIGTTGIYIGDKFYKSINTTPSAYDTIKYMNEMVLDGIKYMVMEVSSQALKYNRVNDLMFDYGVFTNLTLDHVGPGEHSDMDDYVNSKAKLFKQCKIGILNIDDEYYSRMVKDGTCDIYTYGFKDADLKINKVDLVREDSFIGINMNTSGICSEDFLISMPGIFSSYNAACAILTCKIMNIDIKDIKNSLRKFFVKGRVENVDISDKFSLLIDYAHNGVSTKSILETMRDYKPKRIVTIFGCGGNRSRDRRFEMGEMAGKYSDFCIITEDNNRFEEFDDIARDILVGIKKTNCEYILIPDRKEAIRYAIVNGMEGDIIMLLGKGHEDYKEIKGVRYHFDERVIIKEILEEEKINL